MRIQSLAIKSIVLPSTRYWFLHLDLVENEFQFCLELIQAFESEPVTRHANSSLFFFLKRV